MKHKIIYTTDDGIEYLEKDSSLIHEMFQGCFDSVDESVGLPPAVKGWLFDILEKNPEDIQKAISKFINKKKYLMRTRKTKFAVPEEVVVNVLKHQHVVDPVEMPEPKPVNTDIGQHVPPPTVAPPAQQPQQNQQNPNLPELSAEQIANINAGMQERIQKANPPKKVGPGIIHQTEQPDDVKNEMSDIMGQILGQMGSPQQMNNPVGPPPMQAQPVPRVPIPEYPSDLNNSVIQ